ncbi:MAG TPA: ABC transporter ATP-binding protein, partial [Actinomycetota bacterium]|nr:ABC transporter ATP-binding protein [Actinomycetota bacterium]
MGGPGFHPGMMAPPAKSRDFRGSAARLARRLRPERAMLLAVVLLGALSVVFAIVGPKLLGNATDALFEGVINQQLPEGATQDQVVERLRAQGDDQLAEMLSRMELDPGAEVDYARIGRILATLAAVYVISSGFGWAQQYLMAGVAQRTMFRLREDVDRKLGRLPLRFFDDTPRGDVLSRVTNDIDNISTTLQQSLTQIVWAVLTIVGVLIMMLTISPLLALLSVVAVPVSFFVTVKIAKRSQVQFANQWRVTGEVDGYIEEVFTGHNVVKVFGKRRRAAQAFDGMNRELYEASFR